MIYKPADFAGILSWKGRSRSWRRGVVAAMHCANLIWNSRKEKRRKPRNRHRNRGYAIQEMDNLPDELVRRMFRVDRATFALLEAEIESFIQRDEVKAKASSGSAITTRTRLAVTLRWLAGGHYIDLCFAWGISKSAFYSDRGVLWPTIDALDNAFELGLDLNDNELLHNLSSGFKAHSGGVMEGCILAIDGMAVRVRQPYRSEVKDIKAYCSRKGGFALVVMAGCDVNGRFYAATADHSGSTNDCIAWENSALCNAIHEGKLPEQYFIIGDEAFSCTSQVLSPWPGRGIGIWKDSFNFWLSHSRQCIERAYGMLVMRFGIFSRRFTFSFERWSQVIIACIKLHNLCLDRNVQLPNLRHGEDIMEGDELVVNDNHDPETDQLLRARARGNRRNNITFELESQGRTRPAHAQCNSRS